MVKSLPVVSNVTGDVEEQQVEALQALVVLDYKLIIDRRTVAAHHKDSISIMTLGNWNGSNHNLNLSYGAIQADSNTCIYLSYDVMQTSKKTVTYILYPEVILCINVVLSHIHSVQEKAPIFSVLNSLRLTR